MQTQLANISHPPTSEPTLLVPLLALRPLATVVRVTLVVLAFEPVAEESRQPPPAQCGHHPCVEGPNRAKGRGRENRPPLPMA